MEWDLDKYLDKPERKKPAANQSALSAAGGDGVREPRSGRPRSTGDSKRRGAGTSPQQRRRIGSLPPWILVLGCLLFYFFCFQVWTENSFSVGRFLTLAVLCLAFVLLSALLGTIGKKRKLQTTLAMVTVIFWAVMFLLEYFLYDTFKVFFTLSGIFSAGGNAGQEDFAARTFELVFKNIWRLALFALPIVAWFLANRYLRLPRILTRGVRRYLAVGGAALLLIGLFFAAVISPDSRKLGKEYNFSDAVHSFGLPMGLALETFNGSAGGEFEFEDPVFVPTDAPKDSGGQTESSRPVETDPNGETIVPVTTEAPAPKPSYNMLDLDLEGLIANSNSDTVVNVAKYLSTVTPSMTNEMTGMFQGKNLILITAEAFSKEFISEEFTPTLYRMMTKGIYFKDYYQPAWGGSTSSGEFSVMTGIDPARGVSSITNTEGHNMDVTIGNLLKKQGYFTRAYHNNDYTYYSRNKTHENLGYEKFIGMGNGMEEGVKKVWPESDKEMMDFTVSQYIDHQPFSVYYITVSGHGAYTWMGNTQSSRHREDVKDLDYPELIKAYYACNLELELAMKSLLDQLEAAGIADDTLVVLTADHYPYCLEKSDAWSADRDYLSEYYGYTVTNCVQRDHNCLIMWSGCLEDKNIVVEDPCFSLDIVPTLCNLFGVEWDSRLYSGRDVFSDAEPLVFWPDHSWKTDKGTWISAKSSGTEFTPAEGVEVTEDYLNNIRRTVSNKINYAYSVLGKDLDFFKILLE